MGFSLMSASETEIHHSFFSNNNIYTSFPRFFEEISSVLSHGSISFGRYADDSSAWDKRSPFTYNSCQEELEKFKSPGSVAQKKAYFDEFYKNRVQKELPVHQQETNQYGPSQEKEEITKLIGNGINVTVAVKEDKLNNVSQIHISDGQGILKHKEPPCREVKRRHTDDNDATVKKRMKVKQSIDEVENHFDEASVSHPPLPEGNPRCVQGKSIVSSKVKQTIKKTLKHGNVLKDKGIVASVIANKATVRSVTTKDDVMNSRPNPSLRQKASVKVDKSVPSMNESTPNALRNISRKTTEPHSSLPRLSGLSKTGRLVPSCSSSSIKTAEAKPCLKRTKQEPESPVQIPSAQVTKLVSSASNSSIKKAKVNLSSKLEQSRTKLETRSPLPSRSSKSDSKIIALTDGLRNMADCRRGSSDGSSHCMKPGGEESMDPRPKVISRSRLAREKPNHENGVEQNRSYNKERNEEERKDKVQSGLKRYAKHASTCLSCTNKASDRKFVDKIVLLESAELKCDRAGQRGGKFVSWPKRPIWR